MKIIYLSRGKKCSVDDSDHKILGQFKWSYDGSYAVRALKGKKVYMHRIIMKTPSHLMTDHINGDTLDNTRSNLRICTRNQNLLNRSCAKKNVTGFKGVSWDKGAKKWVSHITINGRGKHLGLFTSPVEAAMAYNKAVMVRGEFARLNKFDEMKYGRISSPALNSLTK